MSTRIFARNIALTLAAHVLNRGSLVLSSMILARSLDYTEFAGYGYFQLTVSMLGAYGAMGMGVAAVRYAAEHSAGDDAQRRLFALTWVLSSVMAVLMALLVLVLPESVIGVDYGVIRALYSLAILIIVLGVVPGSGAMGQERYVSLLFLGLLSALVIIIGSMIAAYSGSTVAAIVALIASFLIQTGGSTLVVLRGLGGRYLFIGNKFTGDDMRRLRSLIGPMFFVTILSATGPWILGKSILNGTDGESNFARFTIGLQWFSLAMLLPGMVSRVTLPGIIRARTTLERSSDHEKRFMKTAILISVGTAAIVSVLGIAAVPWVLRFYGDKYMLDSWLLVAFMAAAIPGAPANTLGNALVARNEQRLWLSFTILSFLVLVGVGATAKAVGVWSAPIALAASSLMLSVFAYWAAEKRGLV